MPGQQRIWAERRVDYNSQPLPYDSLGLPWDDDGDDDDDDHDDDEDDDQDDGGGGGGG